MSTPPPAPARRSGRIVLAAVGTAVALAAVAGGSAAAFAATAPRAPEPPTVQQVDAKVARSMVQLGIEWSGYVAYIDGYGDYVWTDEPVTADFICSGWFVDGSGDIVTAGHCVTPKGAKEKLIDALIVQLRQSGDVDDAWIADNQAWAESTWKVRNASGGTTPDRTVVAYQSDTVPGSVLTDVTPASVIAYRSPDDEDAALLNVDAEDTPALPIAATSPKVGQAVTAIGFPGSVQQVVRYDTLEASFKTGTVSSRQVNDHGVAKLEVNADISGGMSGGPTVDRLGNVVGLNSFTINGEQENFNFVTDTVSLRKFLQREGVTMTKPAAVAAARPNLLHTLALPVGGALAALVLGLGALWIVLAARRPRPTGGPGADRPAAPAAPTAPVLEARPLAPVIPVMRTEPAPRPAVLHTATEPVVPVLADVVLCPDGHENPAGARFCSTCGVTLEPQRDHEAVSV
jgi:S1-C subfamily serine protease